MSGNNDGWSFNRFNEYEAKLAAQKAEQVEESTEEVVEEEALHRDAKTGEVVKKAEVGKTYYPAQPKKQTSVAKRKEDEKKAVKEETEDLEEGIDFKGAKRIDDARKAKRDALYKKSPSTKQKDLMKGKFRPGASDEERKSGYRDIMKEKGTQPIKDGKPMFNKEELEATGLFSAEEIEALVEASCGSKGYQEGGEVKCDKCEGKGCDHCKDKGTHSKKEKGAKPDYLDFDKDGNKEEPMKDALKEKGGKKS